MLSLHISNKLRPIVTAIATLLFVGCGGGGDDAASRADALPGDTITPDSGTFGDAEAPTYAMVQSLFAKSCSGYCHAGGSDIGASLVLTGEHSLDGASSLDRPSRQVPRLQLVVPGDPTRSYLMHKLDGTMATIAECASDKVRCGVAMPAGHRELWPEADRNLVRRWITLGALGRP